MPDWEPERVEPAEHRRERRGGLAVDHELPDVCPSVEAPVAHRQQPKLRERHGTAGPPESVLERRLQGCGQRPDRRLLRVERDDEERQCEEPEHCPVQGGCAGRAHVKRGTARPTSRSQNAQNTGLEHHQVRRRRDRGQGGGRGGDRDADQQGLRRNVELAGGRDRDRDHDERTRNVLVSSLPRGRAEGGPSRQRATRSPRRCRA